ncbi:hypothetical protein QVD17_22492 [Tagetes erecta]|uniref:Uncharacterized protein n=1 Tax=Tagetes erecta TaxID=13708 RepID=A0AAD8KGK9_TARER|nr:hypothetical protein QVD17_22492 [Tagetes erecta]
MVYLYRIGSCCLLRFLQCYIVSDAEFDGFAVSVFHLNLVLCMIHTSNHPFIIQEARDFKEYLGCREVQHQEHDEKHVQRQQEMHKRGLRTSWTDHYVDGHFDLPFECVNYIVVRDKCRQRLSRFIGKRLTNVDARRCHLSVYNRLEGWRVETRKRPDKTHDKVPSLD